MEEQDRYILEALEQTRVVRAPKQHLATFGSTSLRYFLVTEPAYSEIVKQDREVVLREGRILARRPEVVTPAYVMNLVGFGEEARRTLGMMARQYGPNSPGLQYTYQNEALSLNIMSGKPEAVAENIKNDLDRNEDNLAVVIRAASVLWDVSLLKFIFEYTSASLAGNVGELMGHRLLESDPSLGIPRGGVERIERLFRQVESGELPPSALKQELDQWGLFSRYEDRFLGLFRKRR